MEAADFLKVAGRLTLSRASGAADYRTAISRAYYAAYHLARKILNEQLNFHCRDENEHRWVQRHFYNCQLADARIVGRLLGSLHDARKHADYDLDDSATETQAQAKFELQRAQEIECRLKICMVATNLEVLRDEMKAYRTKAGVR